MAKNLVIVESPAKAKTIEKFLGPDFEVRASMGHIIDLPTKGLGVDVRHGFQPKYAIIERKEALIKELKSASKKAQTVYLASDPDREGEFIAWALKEMLGLTKPKRAVFNEITKQAVQNGINNTRDIDENLFNAQQARRVLDRLVGYKISPLLWRRVQSNTSAGRVQSVALRLICDRETEVRSFQPEEYWTITALLNKQGDTQTFSAQLVARMNDTQAVAEVGIEDESVEPTAKADEKQAHDRAVKLHITNETDAQAILAQLAGASYRVEKVIQKDVRRQPYLPYTTSTLQQDASVRLHFKPKRTMSIAQQLYEGIELGERGHQGLITYMRTDSTRISNEAQVAVKQYIGGRFGPEFIGAGRTARAKANAQDAHEAIRPTDPTLAPESVKAFLSADQFKLYQLVWRRFVASFMMPAIFDTLRVDISAGGFLFRSNGSNLKFQGFYAVWPHDDEGEQLPALAAKDMLALNKLDPKQHFTQPPPRFTEASLIKELEEKGIGRPSTYVPIISTIQDRGYVEQQERRFVPTWLGETVNDLMVKHFSEIVDANFTADMERRLDAVEEGTSAWTEFLQAFYDRLKTTLAAAEKEMDRVQKPTEELGESCPLCEKPLLVRMGRFGRFISCSAFPECEYRRSFVQKTGANCPTCGGDIVERKSKGRGKLFFGCMNYPTCTFATWNRPLPLPCPECHGLLTQANGAKEAVCQGCGAVVEGITENAPVVTGHRAVGEEKAKRSAAHPKATATADGEEAKPTTIRKRAVAASTTPRTRSASATVARGTTTRRLTGTVSKPKKSATAAKSAAAAKSVTATKTPRPRRRIIEIAGVSHDDA